MKVKNFLDEGVSNNWVSDTYNWSKEIVVVTGGSDGIGMKVVMMLAERGIKVVVLDIQPPKYTGTSLRCSNGLTFFGLFFLVASNKSKAASNRIIAKSWSYQIDYQDCIDTFTDTGLKISLSAIFWGGRNIDQ